MKYAIIGSGRMARSLLASLDSNLHEIHVYARDIDQIRNIYFDTAWTPHASLSEIESEFDVYFLAISDAALWEVSSLLAGKISNRALVIHHSGSKDTSVLHTSHRRKGVVWPIQSLSLGGTELSRVPIVIDGAEEDISDIQKIATHLSNSIYHYPLEKRQKLHLAAAMSNNFITALMTMSRDYLIENQIDPSLLRVILKETVHDQRISEPEKYQTGPALRRDEQAIETHLELLNLESLRELYRLFTTYIQKRHEDKRRNNL